MGKNSNIAWCDHTWSPWQGCRKVSPGCAHCYMYRDKARYGQDPATVVRSKPGTFMAPLRWKEKARVFVCSWSDFFIEDADSWRGEAWEIMRRTPLLTYMLLTKRAENIKDRLSVDWPLKNVWLGVTAENQQAANERIPLLLGIPARIHFISVEPMISPVDLSPFKEPQGKEGYQGTISLVICGGESGPDAREMDPAWALHLKEQCADTNTPFFMKQMSGKAPIPDFLQVREFPRG